MRRIERLLAVAALLAVGCGSPDERSYQLTGQIVAIRPEAREVTIRHDDIEGFMPAMTMPFKVRNPELLENREAGDLVRATLVVRGAEAWLATLTRTGSAPVPPGAPAPPGLAPGDPVPDATLTDHLGETLSLAGLRGHPAAITFIYTRCPLPDFCPAIDRRFARVQGTIRRDPALHGAHLVSISIDPTHDTPTVLRAHANRLGADGGVWRFATGDEQAIAAFGAPFGLTFTGGSPSPADLLHNLRTVVIDPGGRVARIFTGTDWSADQLTSALRQAAGAGGAPDTR